MITARDMILVLEGVSMDLPEGAESLAGVISASDPREVTRFIKEAIVKSSDRMYDVLAKTYPSAPIDYHQFRKMLLDAVKGLDPRVLYREVKEVSKKYGWQLGMIFAIKNILTTFVLPPIFIAFGLKSVAAFVALFPSNVIFVPMLIRYFKNRPA